MNKSQTQTFDAETRSTPGANVNPPQIFDQLNRTVTSVLPQMDSQVTRWCQEGNTEALAIYGQIKALEYQLAHIGTPVPTH